jgi:regulator of cell morphogenesis and NO signaling
MEQLKQMSVGKIVAKNYQAAKVFSRYGIDFCCGGQASLTKACEEKEVPLSQVMAELEAELSTDQVYDFDSYPLERLVSYIEGVHHSYVQNTSVLILKYLKKVNEVHGHWRPELAEIFAEFEASHESLQEHLKEEETILFPFVKFLAKSINEGKPISSLPEESLDEAIRMLEDDHNREGARFHKIAQLTNQYTPPKGACQTFRVSYLLLEEFERDLHKHVHLENNILFPKVKKLLAEIKSA